MNDIKHKSLIVTAGSYELEDVPTTSGDRVVKLSCKPMVVELEEQQQNLRRLNLRLRSRSTPLSGSTASRRGVFAE